MVEKIYLKEYKSTSFWPKEFPAFRLEVPDSFKGIYMGNSVVDAVIARQMADVLHAAADHFDALAAEHQ